MKDRFARKIDKHLDDFLVALFRVQDEANREEPTAGAYTGTSRSATTRFGYVMRAKVS